MLESLPYIPLFNDLETAQIDAVKPLFEAVTCQPNTTIFEQGDPAGYLYLILKGEVAIHYKPYDGPAITLTRLREGDVFGWSAVVGRSRYTSSIISMTAVEALRIRGDDLWTLVREHPETGKIMMERLVYIVTPRWENARAQIQSLLNSIQSE